MFRITLFDPDLDMQFFICYLYKLQFVNAVLVGLAIMRAK
jgi:hypothetical protein